MNLLGGLIKAGQGLPWFANLSSKTENHASPEPHVCSHKTKVETMHNIEMHPPDCEPRDHEQRTDDSESCISHPPVVT